MKAISLYANGNVSIIVSKTFNGTPLTLKFSPYGYACLNSTNPTYAATWGIRASGAYVQSAAYPCRVAIADVNNYEGKTLSIYCTKINLNNYQDDGDASWHYFSSDLGTLNYSSIETWPSVAGSEQIYPNTLVPPLIDPCPITGSPSHRPYTYTVTVPTGAKYLCLCCFINSNAVPIDEIKVLVID